MTRRDAFQNVESCIRGKNSNSIGQEVKKDGKRSRCRSYKKKSCYKNDKKELLRKCGSNLISI